MNWITNYVRPTLQALVGKKNRDVPDQVWIRCPGCDQMLFQKDLMHNLYVCPHCDHHTRVTASQRLAMLYDHYELIAIPPIKDDPLKFKDTKKYVDRLKLYREKTGMEDAILVAKGKMGGEKIVTAVFDFFFMGGSMGMAVGSALIKAAETAVSENVPLLVISASGGARMQEGILALMQLPRSVLAVEKVKSAHLPYLVLLTDPTTGGVSASFAMLGDITFAEPKCLIGFAGRRVIEETTREKLPNNFQRAEYLLDHGMVDRIVHRKHFRQELTTLLQLLKK